MAASLGPRLPVLIAILCIASGCFPLSEDQAAAAGEVGSLVPFEPLISTLSSCHGTESRTVELRDLPSWRSFWSELRCGEGEAPNVDFAGSLVLGVQDREGPTACYGVRIGEVRVGVGGGYTVLVLRHVPARWTPCPMVVVHPAVAVRVPAVRGPLVFEWRTVEGPLPSGDLAP